MKYEPSLAKTDFELMTHDGFCSHVYAAAIALERGTVEHRYYGISLLRTIFD